MTEQEDYLEVERNLEKSLNNIAFDFCGYKYTRFIFTCVRIFSL